MSLRRVGAVVSAPLIGAVAAAIAMLASGAHRRFGVTASETRTRLPGDEILPNANVQNDRARTIEAPPSVVWPWIAQLGQDKAGFYSFEMLENLAGCQITGSARVHLDWQDITVGDRFRLHPDIALRVAHVEPGRSLVVTSLGGQAPGEVDFDITWTFHLSSVEQPGVAPATRLHVRERYETRTPSTRLMIEATSIVSATMTWRMLSRLAMLTTQTST